MAEEKHDRALRELLTALVHFVEVNIDHLGETSLRVVKKAVDEKKAIFVTQIETSYTAASKVFITLKIPTDDGEFQLIPLCMMEDVIPTSH